jgi:hypothetical protein
MEYFAAYKKYQEFFEDEESIWSGNDGVSQEWSDNKNKDI